MSKSLLGILTFAVLISIFFICLFPDFIAALFNPAHSLENLQLLNLEKNCGFLLNYCDRSRNNCFGVTPTIRLKY